MNADDVILDFTPDISNAAGDGCITVPESAVGSGMPVIAVPAGVFAFALRIGRMLRPGVARR